MNEAGDFLDELRECALEVMEQIPGIGRAAWMEQMMLQFPAEIVDAAGPSPREINRLLNTLWESLQEGENNPSSSAF